MYKFEGLTVWKEALVLAEKCYKITSRYSEKETNGLADQLRRASTSILLNIAEGSGAESDKEFARYLYLARKSLYEVVAILKFSEKIYNFDIKEILEQIDLVGKLNNGLIKKLKA
jgi:four helix bundle protein